MSTTATPTAGETLVSTNPFNNEPVGEAPVTPVQQISEIITAAHAAQQSWGELSLADRRAAIAPLGRKIMSKTRELAALITQEMGKPIKEAQAEVMAAVGRFGEELDEIVAALEPELLEDDHTRSTIYRDPLGVCVAITPWNFPLLMPHWLVVPALMAGNAVVLKPSEQTPLIAQAYADILIDLLPENVLQVVHGADDQGKALVAGDVNLITFTGSHEAGQHIMSAASDGLKRLILELGSKDPLIVLDDADVDAAAQFAATNSFRNAGQVCVSTERIYVDDKIADEFIGKLIDASRNIKTGDGADPDTQVGPMVSTVQRDHVIRQIKDAVKDGATLAVGADEADGNFVTPTVLTGCTHEMDILREETFGPVACVVRVKDEDEALRLANDSDLGLGGVIFGEQSHAEQLAGKLKVGMVGINKSVGGAAGAPWVGARQSGYGFHSSRDGHRQFCQTRVVSVAK